MTDVGTGGKILPMGQAKRPTCPNCGADLFLALCLSVSASHSRAVLSKDAVTMRLPSGLNAALITGAVWPLIGCGHGIGGSGARDLQRFGLNRPTISA